MEDFFDDYNMYEHYTVNDNIQLLYYYILFIFIITKLINCYPNIAHLIKPRYY